MNWSLDDLAQTGLQNPPSWVITTSNLGKLKQFCQVQTSLNRRIAPEYFDLNNSSMVFKNGFAPEAGEVFEITVHNVSRQTLDSDMVVINRTGILSANTKIINFYDVITIPSLSERCPITVRVGGLS